MAREKRGRGHLGAAGHSKTPHTANWTQQGAAKRIRRRGIYPHACMLNGACGSIK